MYPTEAVCCLQAANIPRDMRRRQRARDQRRAPIPPAGAKVGPDARCGVAAGDRDAAAGAAVGAARGRPRCKPWPLTRAGAAAHGAWHSGAGCGRRGAAAVCCFKAAARCGCLLRTRVLRQG